MSAMNFSGAVALSGAFSPAPTSCVTYVDDCAYVPLQEEAAGKVGKYLAVAAAIIVPFAAPAVFGAIAGSGVLGASMAAAAGASGFMGTMAGIVGSAITGGIMGGAVAATSGGDFWSAFASSGLGSGMNAFSAGRAAATVSQAATGGSSVASGASSVSAGLNTLATGTTAAAPAASGGIMQSIMNMIPGVGGDPTAMSRIGAMLVNAAVNNQSMGRLDSLVAQQRAELAALRVSDRAAHDLRISEAQKMLLEADRMDPRWYARLAMADVAGMEEKQFNQTMRNIAVRQGGSLDTGQQNAYERKQKLHTARSKALAYNTAYMGADQAQNQRKAQAIGLIGPDDAGRQHLATLHGLEQGQWRAESNARADNFAGLISEFATPNHPDPGSRVPGAEEEEDDPLTADFGG